MGVFDWMSGGGQAGGGGGGYMDQMVNYGMQFGGPQFGISPDQRANYFKQQELAQNLKFINENQIPGQGAYGPEPDGAISANQFNPAKNMELAMRTGQMGQFIAGQQAMERQQQGQHWSQNNMPLADKTRLDVLQTQRKWENERRQFEWNTPSAAQQASNAVARAQLGVSQGQLGLAQQKFAAEQNAAALQRQFPALGLTGQQQMDYRTGVAKMDRAAAIATDTFDYLNTVGTGAKALDRGTVNAMRAAYEQHVVPALATMVGTGTIQQGDMEFIKSVIGEPGGWATLDSKQKAKVGQILQSVQEERARMYGLSGVQAPPIKPGSSAWAKSRGTVNTPDDIQWGP